MTNLLASGIYTAWLIGVCSRIWNKKTNLINGMQFCMDEIELGELIYLIVDAEGNEHIIRSAPFSLDVIGYKHQLCKFKYEMGEPCDPDATRPLLNQLNLFLDDPTVNLKNSSKMRVQVGNSFGKYNVIHEHISRVKVAQMRSYDKSSARVQLNIGYPLKRINLF
jgi:hypothetical protein